MQKTSIEYLTHTWNPVAMRCSKCSPGCDGCWHLRTTVRLSQNSAFSVNERLVLAGQRPPIMREREIDAPLRAKKPAVIGVQFMGDIFHEAVPFEFVDRVMAVIAMSPEHTYLMLTKRPQRMGEYFCDRLYQDSMIAEAAREMSNSITGAIMFKQAVDKRWPNLYKGLTVCNQVEADAKIPVFLQVPGKKFLSIEPMLAPIDFQKIPGTLLHDLDDDFPDHVSPMTYWNDIDAVILGGETGPGARPMHPDWARSIRGQCSAADVPFFFKGWGAWKPCDDKHQECKGRKSTAMRRTGDIIPDQTIWKDPPLGGTDQGFWKAGSRSGRILENRTHDDLPWR